MMVYKLGDQVQWNNDRWIVHSIKSYPDGRTKLGIEHTSGARAGVWQSSVQPPVDALTGENDGS